jgi:hypothetical protein
MCPHEELEAARMLKGAASHQDKSEVAMEVNTMWEKQLWKLQNVTKLYNHLRKSKHRWFFLNKIKDVEGVTWRDHTTTFRMSKEKLKDLLQVRTLSIVLLFYSILMSMNMSFRMLD